jgi:hypothetical protein
MIVTLLLAGCAGKVSSDREAELAYLGLDTAVSRALTLGLQGFSQASSANIDAQTDDGDVSGTMTVTGQVDQGSSDNKGLRLDVALEEYADVTDLDDDEDVEVVITYDTDPDDLPYADLQLRDMPDGTLSGTFAGVFLMSGDLEGPVELSLTIEGPTESDGADGVQRVEGETEIVGTATNEAGGTYEIDVVR